MNDAADKWMFLHTLPRTEIEVSDEVFDHPNSLTWVSSNNKIWITMVSKYNYSESSYPS